MECLVILKKKEIRKWAEFTLEKAHINHQQLNEFLKKENQVKEKNLEILEEKVKRLEIKTKKRDEQIQDLNQRIAK